METSHKAPRPHMKVGKMRNKKKIRRHGKIYDRVPRDLIRRAMIKRSIPCTYVEGQSTLK